MAATESIDPYLVSALKLLHSSAPDSAEKLRTMLDAEISKNHDKSKLISNLLTKKQLNDEKTAPGSGFKKHKPKKPEELKVVRAPTPPDVTMIPDDDDSDSSAGSESAMNDLMNDLTCVTCRQMDNSANNQLFECTECHLLHHQLCHTPKISSETSLTSWVCSSCKNKKGESSNHGSTKSTKSYESSSSSSSSSTKKPTLNVISSTEKKKADALKKKATSSSSSSSTSRSRSSKK